MSVSRGALAAAAVALGALALVLEATSPSLRPAESAPGLLLPNPPHAVFGGYLVDNWGPVGAPFLSGFARDLAIGAFLLALGALWVRSRAFFASDVWTRASEAWNRIPDRVRGAFPFALYTLSVGATVGWVLDGHVVNRDEPAYLVQAEILRRGEVTAPAPPGPSNGLLFNHVVRIGDRFRTIYPPGHPALLALGLAVGAPRLVVALAGAATIALAAGTARRIWGPREGRATAWLLAASPYFVAIHSTFLAHTTSLLGLAAFLGGAVRVARDRRPAGAALAGLGLGIVAATRPYDGILVALPWVVFVGGGMLVRATREGRFGRPVAAVVLAAAAAALPLEGLVSFNEATTGSPLRFPHQVREPENSPGFGPEHMDHDAAHGVRNMAVALGSLDRWLHGVPGSLALALLALARGSVGRLGWVLASCFASLVAGYFMFWSGGPLFLGPNYLPPALLLLVPLAARGVVVIAPSLGPDGAGPNSSGSEGRTGAPRGVPRFPIAFGLAAALYGVPSLALELRRVTALQAEPLEVAQAGAAPPALVFVEGDMWSTSLALANTDPYLGSPILFARSLGPAASRGFRDAFFPDRSAWYLDVKGYSLWSAWEPRLVPLDAAPSSE